MFALHRFAHDLKRFAVARQVLDIGYAYQRRVKNAPAVHGIGLDAQTRCAHFDSPRDVVAIKMRCCGTYFACKECHDALADHALEPWLREDSTEQAVLCGVCRSELTIAQYRDSSDRCPACGARFNANCREHHHYYFTIV